MKICLPVCISALLFVTVSFRGGDSKKNFESEQLVNIRVSDARKNCDGSLKKLCEGKGLKYPVKEVFFRSFKQDKTFEVWGRNGSADKFTLIKTYPICQLSGVAGPKRVQGDGQMPEGFYKIRDFNPWSNFHLSMGVNYPNASDKVLSDKNRPGDNIYIHGNCVSIGCTPLGDAAIEEVYWMAVQARSQGQKTIQVHLFPTKLDDKALAKLIKEFNADASLQAFWKNLQPGYDYFEKNRTLPNVKVNGKTGRYYLEG